MTTQTSTDYSVDNRYRGLGRASDNTEGKHFLNRFINSSKAAKKTSVTLDRKEDDRFIVSAPGWGTNYSFKNAFGSPISPVQRKLAALGQ